MNQIVNSQALLFITCIEIGIIMGMFYDLIRIIRKIVKHANIIIQIQDTFYWIICAFIGFYMLYINNYAAIRPFVFIGILLGITFYFLTFSILFIKLATIIIYYTKKIIYQIIHKVAIPIKALLHILSIPLSWMIQRKKKLSNYKKRKMRTWKRKWYHTKAEIKTELRIMKEKK